MALGALKADSGGGTFEVPPQGTHAARLVAVVDLGTQEDSYQGETKWSHQVYVVWELCEESDAKGERFCVGQKYNYSANPKAKLRLMLEAMRGAKYRDGEELKLGAAVGAACLVTVVHQQSGEKTYANFQAVAQLPKGMTAAAASREPFLQNIEDNHALPDWLPRIYGKRVEDVIAASEERAGKHPSPPPGANPDRAVTTQAKATHRSGNGADYSPKGATSTQGSLDLKSADLPF